MHPNTLESRASRVPSSRFSATTIDVPLFLQAYDPASAPPLPEHPYHLANTEHDYVHSHTEPQRLPPPPPRKIPLESEGESKVPAATTGALQSQLQHSPRKQQQQKDHKLRHPRFEPPTLQGDDDTLSSWQDHEQQPTISAPSFTDFDMGSALPSIRSGQIIKDSSSREQHVNPDHQDGTSMSNTDLSSTTAGKSTPESQQTSNTSYRESDDQLDRNSYDQEGDDSFYWHSGRSSSGTEDDIGNSNSPAATPGQSSIDQRSSTTDSTVVPSEHPTLPVRSTSLSPSDHTSYGASVLGFGGPSDWEYFGDYEAEEIDDEELYSRPRASGRFGTYAGSTELPAELPLERTQQPSRSELSASESVSHGTAPEPHEFLVRQQVASSSDIRVSHDSKPGAQDNHVVVEQLKSPGSLSILHSVPNESAAVSDMSPEQRLDLDDVIRAWSETPFIGSRDDTTIVQSNAYNSEEPVDVAEASLASTPRERMFGVDVILKNAPSLPKFSTFINQAKVTEDQSQDDSTNPVNLPDSSTTGRSFTAQEMKTPPEEHYEHVMGNPLEEAVIIPDKIDLVSPAQITNDAIPLSAESSSSDAPISSLPDNAATAKPIAATDPSVRHSASTEISDQWVENALPAPHDAAPIQIPPVPQHRPAQEVAREVAFRMSQNSLGKTTLDKPDSAPPNSRNTHDSWASRNDGLHTSDPHPSAQTFTETVRSETSDELALPEHSVDLLNKEHFEGLKETDRARLSGQLAEGPDLSRPTTPAKYLLRTEDSNNVNPFTKGSQSGVNAIDKSEPSGAAVALTVQIAQDSSKANVDKNPYGDLDPWGRASLNRFAAMLREEARAESHQEKLNIFNVFTSRESRLRTVLYGTDEELIAPRKDVQHEEPHDLADKPGNDVKSGNKTLSEEGDSVKQSELSTNTMSLQRSLKALPALPTNRDSVLGQPSNALAPLVLEHGSKLSVDGKGPEHKSSFDDVQHSLGGIPGAAQLCHGDRKGGQEEPSNIRGSREDVAEVKARQSPSFGTPTVEGREDSEIKKIALPPPRCKEPRSEIGNYLANRKSVVVRPYANLTQGSLESGSTFGKSLDFDTITSSTISITTPRSQHDQDASPKRVDASEGLTFTNPIVTAGQHGQQSLMEANLDPLFKVLPVSGAVIINSPSLGELRHAMDVVPDDFSFIHKSVVAWDAKAKKQREEFDRQRHARQMESEQRIDSLFDDHEIGYGDISELESEFKRSEAARKADEDRSEYQMFVSDVFDFVWTELHYELDQLVPHYKRYSELMNDALAGKDMFDGSSDSLALAPTMSSFLGLHQKIEIRHQKAFEAVLERDRRLKKTEISPWYTLSNIAKVKQLEKQFEDAEKKAIIEYCQQRDTRANQLMDVLDQNTLRGVGANQDYMEAIMKAVRTISSRQALASVPGPNEPIAGMKEVEKARSITTLLATSSEQIVQTFHVADMLLNSADYEVSVAKAKVAKADMATLAKLKEERAKEDQKLMRDLEHRLALIREDTRKTNDEIVTLMLFLGAPSGQAVCGATAIQRESGCTATVPSHEARVHEALEEAKRRNALRESGG